MNIILHSTIIKNTATSEFVRSISDFVLPSLVEKYGDVKEIQMYEDYLSDNLTLGEETYYPLTVLLAGGVCRQWIKWNTSDKSLFGTTPYAYKGEEPLVISLCEPPSELEEKIKGRDMYYEYESAVLSIDTVSTDDIFLAGKYSQTFVDEMTRSISSQIRRTFSISTLKGSGIVLHLVFAPGTYMEHIVGNITYRRLLITAEGCSARDLWIKWTHVGSDTPVSVCSHKGGGEVIFELAEDVPHKIREKEYRFLARTSPDKYQYAMGRKNVTEWRDLIKRAIKRGDVVKLDGLEFENSFKQESIQIQTPTSQTVTQAEPTVAEQESNEAVGSSQTQQACEEVATAEPEENIDEPQQNTEIEDGLRAVLGISEVKEDEEEENEDTEDIDIKALLMNALRYSDTQGESAVADTGSVTEEESAESEDEYADEYEAVSEADEQAEADALEEYEMLEGVENTDEGVDEVADPDDLPWYSDVEETPYKEDTETSDRAVEQETVDEVIDTEEIDTPTPEIDEDELRRRIEEEVRARLENDALAEIRQQIEELRHANEELRIENERLVALARRTEEKRIESDAEYEEENERLRKQLEAVRIAEEREKARMAEAGRLAILEQQRLKAMREEEEKLLDEKDEEERLLREKEEERLRIAREAEERKRLEEERLREEERIAEEKREEERNLSYTYVSKNARLIFNKPVDPNIIKRIHEIMLTTIKYFHKENVYIKIKASLPDATTVNLFFEKYPEEENELLVNIIKVLGRSGLGIIKVYLE